MNCKDKYTGQGKASAATIPATPATLTTAIEIPTGKTLAAEGVRKNYTSPVYKKA